MDKTIRKKKAMKKHYFNKPLGLSLYFFTNIRISATCHADVLPQKAVQLHSLRR